MYKKDTNVLLAMQPISPDYYSAKVDLSLLRDLTNCSASHFAEMAPGSRSPASFTVCGHTRSFQQVSQLPAEIF
jgi:hypothetical protein